MTVYREDRWTKARPWCPHPERWTSTDPQSTEIEVSELVGAFVRALQPDYVIETGTCIGQTALSIGLALQANGQGQLDTLEPTWDRVEFSRKRLVGLPVQVWKIESLDFVPARPVDFLWLDSRMDLRVPEFEHFRAWTRPGTIAGFHDTAPHQDDQWGEAIDAIPGVRPIRLRTPRGVTFVEVL
jgi:predicted O-methyltransferase YrrM